MRITGRYGTVHTVTGSYVEHHVFRECWEGFQVSYYNVNKIDGYQARINGNIFGDTKARSIHINNRNVMYNLI